MAGKPQNRLELRRQYEAAEPPDPMEDETDEVAPDVEEDEAVEKKPKKKAKAPAKSKSKSSRPAKPAARMRIVWVVMNDAFKPVATFDYSQKEAAETRAAELTAKGRGTHFVQRTKEAMPDDAPGLGAIIPRPEPAAKKAAVKEVEAAIEEEEDIEEEEEEVEIDDEPDDDDE
ncbi:hypothetical protein OJF2_19150 [Aquisphaera giovannonii]|uniref:Uncharacterized protein n=1 Tax=Aquisphaera giovannonii TaxID=406548 RepID=A0A5B9VYJ2_9BACT|nr:hypothetical protein [Aquisphaera giovannonii]QEH33413.1 hypothetical protein OJF2_19150 [Aquisphaera giovannonii]